MYPIMNLTEAESIVDTIINGVNLNNKLAESSISTNSDTSSTKSLNTGFLVNKKTIGLAILLLLASGGGYWWYTSRKSANKGNFTLESQDKVSSK